MHCVDGVDGMRGGDVGGPRHRGRVRRRGGARSSVKAGPGFVVAAHTWGVYELAGVPPAHTWRTLRHIHGDGDTASERK